jgi:UDP:flavonoid glycosyltransferase YjiC (YdhE family)
MHLIVSGFGSYGDVLPMVGLGAAMLKRGHRVQALVNPYFRSIVEDAGLELLPLGTAEEYLALSRHPHLWRPVRGLKLVISRAAKAYMREAFAILRRNYVAGETVLAAHGLDLASRVFHESHGAPMASVHFAPFALYTLYETPRYIGVPSMRGWPRWLKRLQFAAGDKFVTDPIVAPTLNAIRAEHGLPPVRHIFTGWNQSPQLVLGMWPKWYGPAQPDWPPQTELVGFPLWDPRPAGGLPAKAEEFLQAGDPPIVFAPGSANTEAEAFFRTAVAVCERLGRRGILATKFPEQLPQSLPDAVRHFTFLPFSLLLPRAAALVHHGGIGTCAQGLASGVPQVVRPMAYDQLDNGLRLKRLGVGDVVRMRGFKPARVAEALARLLNSSQTAASARRVAAQCDGIASLTRACELLEKMPAASATAPSTAAPSPAVSASVGG